LTGASTGVGHQRYDDRGALLRFKKSHSPTTALAIIDAIQAFVRPDRVAGQYPNGGQ
jgi:phosphoserine phosphatase RsbU/P